MTKDHILKNHEYDVHYYGGGRRHILEAMDIYAKQILELFGDWNLSNEIQFQKGKNLGWGNLSYFEKINKFFKEIINEGGR